MSIAQADRSNQTRKSSGTDQRSSEPFWGATALMLGILVAVVGFFAVMMWSDARNARDDAHQAAAGVASTSMAGMPGMTSSASTSSLGDLTSYAGAAPANASAIAAAHRAYPATLPAAQAGPVADVHLALTDINIQIAPGRPLRRLGLGRRRTGSRHPRATGPARQDHPDEQRRDPALGRLPRRAHRTGQGVHGRAAGQVGQLHVPRERRRRLHVPLRNEAGARCTSRTACTGRSSSSRSRASCRRRTRTTSSSRASGTSTRTAWTKPAQFNMTKAHARQPDWMTFNGYAGQYVKHPLTANPGELVRFWVVDAGPRSTPTSTSSARSSTPRTRSAT